MHKTTLDHLNENVRKAEFWTNSKKQNPDQGVLLSEANVVSSIRKAIDGKWVAANKKYRKNAVKFIKSNARFDNPIIVFWI